MKTVLCALNSKYSHTSLALRCLKEYAVDCGFAPEIAEYTINHDLRKIVADLYAKKADFYGFSVYVFNVVETLWVIRDLKKILPSAVIFCGGPEVSFEEETFLRENPEVGFVMRGEGEKTFAEVLSAFETVSKSELMNLFFHKQLEGVSFLYNSNFVRNPSRHPVCCLDEFPFPYRDRADLLRNKDRILYYESSRGCPFGCSYCMSSLERSVRTLSLQRTFSDLAVFLETNVRLIKFVDRTFNFDRGRCMEILRFLRDHDNGVTSFHFEMSPTLIDQELLEFVRTVREGLFLFEVGLQSANPDTLQAIGRKQDTLALGPALQAVSASNVHLHLDLIAGLPYEDYSSFGQSFDVAMSFFPDVLQLGFLKILKGAPISFETQHMFRYSLRPPYEILENRYISFEDLEKLKQIEEVFERYFNSGLFRGSFLYFAEHLFSGGFFSLAESLTSYLQENGFFAASVSENALGELLHGWLLSLPLSPDVRKNCENRLAFDLYRKSPVLNPPSWLANLPDQKRLVSLLKNPSWFLPVLPAEVRGIFPGEDSKKWYRRARIVSFFFNGKKETYLFLYPNRSYVIPLD